MRKLLLLDADVIIDLHTLGMFGKIKKSYNLYVTSETIGEAKYYYQKNKKFSINIRNQVTIIDDIELSHLQEVREKAKEAFLAIDPGESTSIAYLLQTKDDISFCSCDRAAIKLISYMGLEDKSTSLEYAAKNAGHHTNLFPRHLESTFKNYIKEGKVLLVQFMKLT